MSAVTVTAIGALNREKREKARRQGRYDGQHCNFDMRYRSFPLAERKEYMAGFYWAAYEEGQRQRDRLQEAKERAP